MGTTLTFNRAVSDSITQSKFDVEVGRTNNGGDGPQMYLIVDGRSILLSHEDAAAFCEGVAQIAQYFSYKSE